MKSFLLLVFLSIFNFTSFGHEYFFGFAEIAYNADDKNYQGTLSLSTHDLEEWFQAKGLKIDELEHFTKDEDMQQKMAELLFQGFKIRTENQNLEFQLIGYEVSNSGMTNFYFTSQSCDKGKELNVTFDLMMKELPKQQNKLTYFDNGKSSTAVFLNNKTNSILHFE